MHSAAVDGTRAVDWTRVLDYVEHRLPPIDAKAFELALFFAPALCSAVQSVRLSPRLVSTRRH